MRFWVLVALGFGLASLRGYIALDTASPRTIAIVLDFAGGAVLTIVANAMMPEAPASDRNSTMSLFPGTSVPRSTSSEWS